MLRSAVLSVEGRAQASCDCGAESESVSCCVSGVAKSLPLSLLCPGAFWLAEFFGGTSDLSPIHTHSVWRSSSSILNRIGAASGERRCQREIYRHLYVSTNPLASCFLEIGLKAYAPNRWELLNGIPISRTPSSRVPIIMMSSFIILVRERLSGIATKQHKAFNWK